MADDNPSCPCHGTSMKTRNNGVWSASRLGDALRCWQGCVRGEGTEALCSHPLHLFHLAELYPLKQTSSSRSTVFLSSVSHSRK